MSKKNKSVRQFLHAANAHCSGAGMQIRLRHGMAGYGVYIALLELMTATQHLCLERNYRALALTFCVSEELIRSVVEDFNLFIFSEGGDCFFSPEVRKDVLKKEEKKQKASEKARQAAKARWNEDIPTFDFTEGSFLLNAPSIEKDAPSIENDAPSIKNDAPSIKIDAPSIKIDAPSIAHPKSQEKEKQKETSSPIPPTKEKEKEKENLSLSTPTRKNAALVKSDAESDAEKFKCYDEWIPQLTQNALWREDVGRIVFRKHFDPNAPQFSPDALISEFTEMQRAGGLPEPTFSDFRLHFSRWLIIKLSNTKHHGQTTERSRKREANTAAIQEFAKRTQNCCGENQDTLPEPL